MNIVVFIKEIPLSNNVKIDPKTNNLVRSGEQGRINPYDEHAIETALQLKEKFGGSVRVVSMGPDSFKMSLRETLAMGCDEAYLISSRAFAGSDTLATAYTLAQAIRKMGDVDVMLFGLKTVDADTGQVGPLVAEELDIPQITGVSGIVDVDLEKKTLDAVRTMEMENQVIRASYPLVLTVGDDMNEPRYIFPSRIKKAMQQEITVWNEVDIACDPERVGVKGSPSLVTDTYVPDEATRQMTMLEGTPMEAAEQLLNILREKHII